MQMTTPGTPIMVNSILILVISQVVVRGYSAYKNTNHAGNYNPEDTSLAGVFFVIRVFNSKEP